MTVLKRHNPNLLNRLRLHFEAHSPNELLEDLQQLSHQDFRTAGYLLSTSLLIGYPTYFWSFFQKIVPISSKAYLGTFLKAAVRLYKNKQLQLDINILTDFAQKATLIDTKKILSALLPVLFTPEEVHSLLKIFIKGTPKELLICLFGYKTLPCCYEFFRICRQLEEQTDLLRHYCIKLMQQDEVIFYNLASVLQSYFDLGELPGTFSLRVKTYQLSRLDDSYDSFCKLLK